MSPMRAFAGVVLVVALGVASRAPAAEALYVDDRLVISVTAAPDGSGEPLATLKSGDRVELLERKDERSRVRLSTGEEGWVQSNYLSADPPARLQLEDRMRELGQLRSKVAQLQAQLSQAREARPPAAPTTAVPTTAPSATASAIPAVATSQAPSALSETAPGRDPALEDRHVDPPLFSGVGGGAPRPGWVMVVGAAAAALLAGFALGWRVLDRRIRSKYGGLRIY